jgi:hypothetical protein
MADPTLEEVAKAWAIWVAGDIVEDLENRDLVTEYLDEVKDVLIEHLTDVAISNARRVAGPTTTDMATQHKGKSP